MLSSVVEQTIKVDMQIVIADDHALVRESLAQNLTKRHTDAKIIEVENGQALSDALNANPNVSLVLLDLRMPDTEPFSLLETITRTWPDLKCVVLSASEDEADVEKSIDCGAHGFVQKSTPTEELLGILDDVMDGKIYVPKTLSLTADLSNDSSASGQNKIALPSAITQRQKDVLKLLLKGKTNHHIAEELKLSECTIKIHLANIYKTLNVSNRTEAVIKASLYRF